MTIKKEQEKKKYLFPKGDVRVNIETARVYHFRWPGNTCGWAIFTVCDVTGEFSIQSDWGNFSYRWDPRHLGAKNLTHFLAGYSGDTTTEHHDCSHYVMDKFSYAHSKETEAVFDMEATRRELRNLVGEHYRDTACSKEEIQELLGQVQDFVDEAENTSVDIAIATAVDEELNEMVGHEIWNHLNHKAPGTLLVCRDELLPRFFAYLREEIKREETVARFASTEPPVSPAQRAVMEESGLAVFAAVKCAHTEALAERLDATHKGEVKAGSGYFGALQTAADVAALRKKDEES